MSFIRHSINVLIFLCVAMLATAQTESELKENASELFEDEQYVEATSLYLHLLSLSPKSPDYNFRYGTCLLFNSFQKKEAIRYLKFAVKDPNIDPRAHYFFGKALHLNYQFKEAQVSYRKYLAKRSKKDKRYDVEREIQMCDDGKKLLSSFTDIIVLDKKEIAKEKFFRVYSNMRAIGGTILVSVEFQSKLDRKKNHVPVVHFPPNAQAIYYSSYGNDESTGKDIYVRKRLPNNKWGEPQLVAGGVNTNEDEDFPYMHPDGISLFFSSRGHNSMGGYDVFYSELNENGVFGKARNVDFAISSPDDDLFYVVDSLHQNAYFASARQSQDGKLHVYQIKVDRIPIKDVIIMGDFLSEINPDNKKMVVEISDQISGESVGTIKSGPTGKYSFVFPRGGKYEYAVTVEGSEDVYKFVVEIPFLKEFKALKQKAVHKMVDGNETVSIINLFDETPEGSEALIAEVIRKRSELNVNVDQFDLNELEAENERNELLVVLGFENMTMPEISGQLEELALTEGLNIEKSDRIDANIDAEIIELSERLGELDQQLTDILEEATMTDDPTKRHELLTRAKTIELVKRQLGEEIEALSAIRADVLETLDGASDGGIGKLNVIENQFNALLSSGKEDEALKLLADNKDLINQTRESSPQNYVNGLVEESVRISDELKVLKGKEDDLEADQNRLESSIRTLNNQLATATKKKDIERLENDIATQQEELNIVNDLLEGTRTSIATRQLQLSVLDNNIASIQKAMLEDPVAIDSSINIEELVSDAAEASDQGTAQTIDQELEELITTHPELDPTYVPSENISESQFDSVEEMQAENAQEILGNPELTEEEKLNQLIDNNSQAIGQADSRINEIETIEEAGNGTPELNQEKERIEEFKQERIIENQEYTNDLEAVQPTIDVAVSPEDVIEEVNKRYDDDIAKINNDDDLTPKEKLEMIQEVDQGLLVDLGEEVGRIDEGLSENPEDQELIARKEIVESVIAEKQGDVSERTQTINAMDNVSSVVDPAEVKSSVEAGLTDHSEEKNEIEASDKTDFEKNTEVLQIEEERLEELIKTKDAIEKELTKTPDDVELRTRLDVVNQMISEQKEVIAERKSDAINSASDEELNTVITKVDRRYSVDIGELEQSTSPTKHIDIAEREGILQEALIDEIERIEDDLEGNPSASAEIDLAIAKKALAESKVREDAALSGDPIPVDIVEQEEKKSDYINELRAEAIGDDNNILEVEYETENELQAQDQTLAEYENELETRISGAEENVIADPTNEEMQTELDWLKEEQAKVGKKRRSISVTLGELETDVAENTTQENPVRNVEDDPVLNSLSEEAATLEEKLNDPSLDKKQRKVLEGQLEEVQDEATTRENDIYQENIEFAQEENVTIDQALSNIESSDGNNEVVSQARTFNESESEAIDNLLLEAENAGSEEERNFILAEAERKQDALNNAMSTVVQDEERKDLEEENEITLLSTEELEKKRRTITVQIGDLTTEILKKDDEISRAKKKEIPALTEERDALIEQRSLIESQLRRVEEQLLNQNTSQPVVSQEAVDSEVTFNEERETAATDEYEEYYEIASQALEEEQQIANLEVELNEARAEVNTMLSEPRTPENIAAIEVATLKVKGLEDEINRLNIALVQSKYAADEALPENEEEAMRMQNLLMRGIRPLKATAIAAALIQLPSNGLAISTSTESTYTEANPIPVDVESPTGLVYRVQIGAFAKPIPQDLFKEFNPVSGEKINGTNVTRYMAGFFNNSTAVVDARQQIRGLGYSDAFVVAYCDGERITFGDARRREAEGTCVPSGTNEIMMEVAANTAEALGIPLTDEVQEVPEHTYNEAPGAVEADPIEIKQGLFFTVQIGVFNRPVGEEFTYGMAELMTIRLPNGQIRYASGMFDSVEEALPRRQEALNKGVRGAFVTAYFEGERITLSEAKKLLAERGSSILQSEIEKKEVEPVVVIEDTPPVVVIRTDTVSTVNIKPVETLVGEQRIQIVTKKQFDEFPRDVLNRYNAEGTFFFDENDGRVKSIIYKHEDHLPRLWNFRDDIDTVYLSMDETIMDSTKILEVNFTDSIIPGDFIDWLLRFNYRREFIRVEGVQTLRIFGVEPNRVQEVQAIIRRFALEATEVEETEHELELEEH
ncbi:MAG: hypothetical protein QNK23_12415 [Crocinitomicaceae bacterium]|nr:hypothetical protein [Crocinitomicaceae bacterium]